MGSFARENRPQARRRLRDALLAALGILGAFAYFNFGQLHFPNFIHVWDTYHYDMGSKYFPELGYERIYECTIVAEKQGMTWGVIPRKSRPTVPSHILR